MSTKPLNHDLPFLPYIESLQKQIDELREELCALRSAPPVPLKSLSSKEVEELFPCIVAAASEYAATLSKKYLSYNTAGKITIYLRHEQLTSFKDTARNGMSITKFPYDELRALESKLSGLAR